MAFASAKSYVAFVRPMMLTPHRLALLLPRDTLSMLRAVAMTLINLLLTTKPLVYAYLKEDCWEISHRLN